MPPQCRVIVGEGAVDETLVEECGYVFVKEESGAVGWYQPVRVLDGFVVDFFE